MCNKRSYFSSYKSVHKPTIIENAGGNLSAIEIGNVLLTIESKSEKKSQILLFGVLHVPS